MAAVIAMAVVVAVAAEAAVAAHNIRISWAAVMAVAGSKSTHTDINSVVIL